MATMLKDSETITVTKLHPVIGAEVGNIDLSRDPDHATIAAIRQAWNDHTVLVLHDQNLSGENQLRFAERFGFVAERHKPKEGASHNPDSPDWTNLMPIGNEKDADGKPIGALGNGDMWFHSDKCYHERPHRFSFLYGIQIPAEGGHTKFSCLYAAYDNVPDDLKRKLDGARVMQGYDYGATARLDLDVNLDNIFHYCQPMIVTNPGSGRKALYVSRLNTMWIEGMDRDESEAILAQLFDITEDPAITYEHVWRPGDLLLWDNWACLHARTGWPDDQIRMLRRCTTQGERLG